MTADDRAVSVLLVEDSSGDARLVEEAFEEVDPVADLTVATDGRSALEHLQSGRDDAELPSLVLLDCHLPDCAGGVVLEEMKSDPVLRQVPVVVFSDSDERENVRQMYDLHANAYITKPHDMDTYVDVVEQLVRFWFSTVQLSPEVEHGCD